MTDFRFPLAIRFILRNRRLREVSCIQWHRERIGSVGNMIYIYTGMIIISVINIFFLQILIQPTESLIVC